MARGQVPWRWAANKRDMMIDASRRRGKLQGIAFAYTNAYYLAALAMNFDGFDWDLGNVAKCEKHGVSREEIESLFEHELRVAPDIAHSTRERRFRAVGRTRAGRAVFLVFTLRKRAEGLLIRPISARYMHRKEVEAHEKEIP